MFDEKDEGLASWATDIRFAEGFKGCYLEGAVSAAIFRHTPQPGEVVVSLSIGYSPPGGVNSTPSAWSFSSKEIVRLLRNVQPVPALIGSSK